MIWSVSTSERRSGSTLPLWLTNLSMTCLRSQRSCSAAALLSGPSSAVLLGGPCSEVGRGGQLAGHGGGGSDLRRDQMGTPTLALPALEVAVGRGSGALAGAERVGVHAQTHGAAREPPLGAGLGEDLVEALLLGGLAHLERARD